MAEPFFYERLSAQDSSFLIFEGPATHMHIGGTTLFETGPLSGRNGGVDIDRIRAYVASRLHAIPRYRQRLHTLPFDGAPAWVDADLNLDYHVRHTSLPKPGTDDQLKALSARILSQQLDRSKPLWELWIVEGLRHKRFAMILKTHHCIVDGVSGVDLVAALLRPTEDASIPTPPTWRPRRVPSAVEVLRTEAGRYTDTTLRLGNLVRTAWNAPQVVRERITDGLEAMWQTLDAGLRSPAETPLNRDIGPYRRFDWTSFDLGEVKTIKNRLGGTINDVVLATVAGAVRHFLRERRARVDGVDYRCIVPVSIRPPEVHGPAGNRVSAWMLSLPIDQPDAGARMAEVCATTDELRRSKLAHGIEVFTQIAELAAPILTLGVRLAARIEPYNLIVTNVPGPQQPLYLLGARMLAGYPQVPLFEKQGLAVALLSYSGRLHWGFQADWDLVPDLHRFTAAVERSFRELLEAAGAGARDIPRIPAKEA